MRISNISRQSFGALLVPNTEAMHKKVDQLDDSTLDKLTRLKEELANTNYYHLKVDENLNFEIVCDIDTPWGGDGWILRGYDYRKDDKVDMYWQSKYQGSLSRTKETYLHNKNKRYIICEAKGENRALLSSFKHIESLCWIIDRMEKNAEIEKRHQQERARSKADLFA